MKKQRHDGRPRIVVVLGQTATGKSDLAVEIACRFGGEVVSADSRQVYRGLDIGAGKITTREMRGVPHHLLNVADPKGRRYTAEDFRRDAARAIDGIIARGKVPIVCGGTGFYIDALLSSGSFPAVPPDQRLRARLARRSTAALMRELRRLDPRRARDIDPHNKVRIIRAIEIARALGKVPPLEKIRAKDAKYETLFIGLTADRPAIRARIRARLLKRMKGDKMIREVARLHKKGVSWKRLHEFGLEYRHIADHIRNKTPRERTLARLGQDIFDFSKRQMRWFKRNPAITWFSPRETRRVLQQVQSFLRPRLSSRLRGPGRTRRTSRNSAPAKRR
ncbi:MAG: tRNA (adenosine(37)-N6)-dimethylallyltransferase MiaA [Patescibacteria group bacterium]|nr:tRNA (adenosine(37)-N6)-dimethylallyltransferase MiaA [Patescibacteria group bacterium]MDE2116434.1 tRNA (adenosine(37)-N6)-dimethylallyltransferase MiaA [Patescibacteria group bacterium]